MGAVFDCIFSLRRYHQTACHIVNPQQARAPHDHLRVCAAAPSGGVQVAQSSAGGATVACAKAPAG